MKKTFLPIAICSSILLLSQGVRAELPELNEKPFLGYFVGVNNKKLQFGITADGKAVLYPLKRDGSPVALFNPIPVTYEILETMPDGKVVSKAIKPATLASSQPATLNPKTPVTLTGKVTGDAAFEISVTEVRDGFSLSGKVTDKGTLTNPLKFAISINFNPYKERGGKDDAAREKFVKSIKRDDLKLVAVGGKKGKIGFTEEVNVADEYSDGITSATLETGGYGGVEFTLEATGDSKIVFQDKGKQAVWNGFTTKWSVNEGGDAAQAKLLVTAK